MTATLTAVGCKLLALILADRLCSQAGGAKHVTMTHWQRRLRKRHFDHGVYRHYCYAANTKGRRQITPKAPTATQIRHAV